MSENVKIKILDIDAQKSTQSIADLKKQIKDLKGQLAGLTEGTDEYNAVLAECAEKTHKLKEINEQVAKSSMDFGDVMSDVSGTISGMSGAIGAVTGMLALMGVEADKDSKLIKIMVAAMSITSGVQAVEAGVKAFGRLTTRIKQASTAAKGFQASLGWIALALTAIVAIIGSLQAAQDKAEESAAKYHEERLRRLKELYDKLSSFEPDYSEKASDALDNMDIHKYGELIVDVVIRPDGSEIPRYMGELQQLIDETEEDLDTRNKEISKKRQEDALYEISEEGMQTIRQYHEDRLALNEMYWAQEQQAYQQNVRRSEREVIDAHEARLKELRKQHEEILQTIDEFEEDSKKNTEKAAADEKAAQDRARAAADRALQERLKRIKDAYNVENAAAKIAYNNQEITEVEYLQRMYDNLVDYHNKVKNASKQTAGELKQMELDEQEAAMKVAQARIKAMEAELQHVLTMSEKPMVQRSTAGDSNAEASENLEMARQIEEYRTKIEEAGILERMRLNEEYQEWLTNLEDTQALARLQREAQALREELEILTLNKDNQLANIMQRYDGEKEILDARLSENLISQEEYDRQLEELNKGRLDEETALNLQFVDESAAIQAQITATERDAAMQRIEISEKERQKKIENVKKYMSAATSALSMSSQLISALQENLDTTTEEGFEQNKKYEMANATISFLQGLISAWSSAMELGPVAGPIAGGVLTALLTAIYGANMAKIQSTTLNSGSQGGGASMNKVTLQSIEHPISNVRQTTTASDYEELNANQSDTRVYVLASDIEEVTGQRRAQVSNATY